MKVNGSIEGGINGAPLGEPVGPSDLDSQLCATCGHTGAYHYVCDIECCGGEHRCLCCDHSHYFVPVPA